MSKKYMVHVCNPLEFMPTDMQQLFIDREDIESFLSMLEGNDKAIIIYTDYEE